MTNRVYDALSQVLKELSNVSIVENSRNKTFELVKEDRHRSLEEMKAYKMRKDKI